ncbi:alpha/beta fold hydrolase [Singulisphaera sp. PoT]|uniref:alpha/beta fold hydrolase n=1 Tax=Singulisphaera sp. PoT TaxID=3411797 RepID=UPI003BF4A5EA
MRQGRPLRQLMGLCMLFLAFVPGCASMRRNAATADLRPNAEGYAYTSDGWRLGMRQIRPAVPDPNKLPVVLCHGLGLNATFWTITDNHLPEQLAAQGYEVFLVDLRGSGESSRAGRIGRINSKIRQTFLREWGEASWNCDEMAFLDIPAVLNYVQAATGQSKVNWIGHSLGGMIVFPFLELSPERDRIANFVGMGSTITLAEAPQRDMLRANRGLRVLAAFVSTGRISRPLMFARFPGLDRIDQFYYTSENVDKRTIQRFYGYTIEDTGRSALKQLDPYLEFGHFLSADRSKDYAALLNTVSTPTLMVAGESDCMSDLPSTELTLAAIGSADKSLQRYGKRDGYVADYGHCDLVWSRYAPKEIFPNVIDWLNQRQPASASHQAGVAEASPTPQFATSPMPSPQIELKTIPRPAAAP